MALLKPSTKRLEIPHEPGEWIVIRRLASMGSLDTVAMARGSQPRLNEYGRYLASAIVEWSYPDPPTADVIAGKPNSNGDREGGLDPKTAGWLIKEISAFEDGNRTEAALLAGSSPSTGS